MFSSDKNIETIAELVESIKQYLELQKGIVQLNVVDKVVRLLTWLALTIILSFFVLLIVIALSFAVVCALSLVMPPYAAYLIMAAFYIILFLLVITNRKSWIERPIVRMLAGILTE